MTPPTGTCPTCGMRCLSHEGRSRCCDAPLVNVAKHTSELRAAAERLVAMWSHPEYRGSRTSNDALALARAYLAEHPTDDLEPVTEEWLRSLTAFDNRGDIVLEVAVFGSVCHLRFAPDPLDGKPCHSWSLLPSGGSSRVWLPGSPIRRGHVRRLCAALGVELEARP